MRTLAKVSLTVGILFGIASADTNIPPIGGEGSNTVRSYMCLNVENMYYRLVFYHNKKHFMLNRLSIEGWSIPTNFQTMISIATLVEDKHEVDSKGVVYYHLFKNTGMESNCVEELSHDE